MSQAAAESQSLRLRVGEDLVDEIVGISHTNYGDGILPPVTRYLVVWAPREALGAEWVEHFFHTEFLETASAAAWTCDLTTWKSAEDLHTSKRQIEEFHMRFMIPPPLELPSEYVFTFRAPSVRRNPKSRKLQYLCAWDGCGDIQDKKDSANKHAYSAQHFSPFHVRLPFGAQHPFFCHSCCARDGRPSTTYTQKSPLLAHIQKHHLTPVVLAAAPRDTVDRLRPGVEALAQLRVGMSELIAADRQLRSNIQQMCNLLDDVLFDGVLALESVAVAWVPRLTGAKAECEFQSRPGSERCFIELSKAALLPRHTAMEIVCVLLHEMIHGMYTHCNMQTCWWCLRLLTCRVCASCLCAAYLFIGTPNTDDSDHGPQFQQHRHCISKLLSVSIPVSSD